MPMREDPYEGIRNRRYESSNGTKNEQPQQQSEQKQEYNSEQLAAVERVRRCKNYYEILGLTKDAGDTELRRNYKKLALQFHPDKNKTPGAVEAFKAIGNAFAVLSDTQKRKQYDMYGLEGAQRVHSHTDHNDHTEFTFQGDLSPEDICHMFFGAGFANAAYGRRGGNQWRYHARTHHTHPSAQEESRNVLLQILPLLILVSLSLLSNFLVSDPPYSLSRTTKYMYERKTQNLDVPYYVKENFASEYKGRILNIEKQIEDEYLINMRSSCYREKNYKESMIWRAKTFRDVGLEEKARALRTPSCDALNELYMHMNRGY